MPATTLQPAPVLDCGKRTYANKPIAEKLARRVNESGREHVAPYHCTRCHGWHLGTQRRKLDMRKEMGVIDD